MKQIFTVFLSVSVLVIPMGMAVAQDDDGSFLLDDGHQYFPTEAEQGYLYGEYGSEYPRSYGSAQGGFSNRGQLGNAGRLGPDERSLTSSGLWEATQAPPNYYERNDGFYGPAERFLNIFSRREGIDDTLYVGRSKSRAEADYVDNDFETIGGVSVDFGLPFTREFDPDRAHFKLGPAYLDVLSISGTLLYTDFNGGAAYGSLPSDGTIGVISLSARTLVRLTDNLYLAAIGTVYYLPDDGEVGFYFPVGNDTVSGLSAHIAWDKQFGEFEFQAYDEFQAYYRIYDLYDSIETDEIDAAGRYRFGRIDAANDGATDYFDEDNLYYVNDVGFRLAWDDESPWRVQSNIFRRDVWTGGGDHQDPIYYGSVRVDYDRQDWRLAPFAEYRIRAMDDDIDSLRQEVWLGVRGPITQNISLLARAGYSWTSGFANDTDRFLWEIGLQQFLGPATRHSVFFGQTVSDGQIGDEYYGDYLRYTLQHQFCANLIGSVFGQIADVDNRDMARGNEGTLWLAGARLIYALGDFSNVRLEAFHEDVDYDFQTSDYDRWVYRARYSQRVFSRLWASVLWQYEEYDATTAARDFDEQLVSITLTRYF